MPSGFRFPFQSDLWWLNDRYFDHESRGFRIDPTIARLKPGVSPEQAQAEMKEIAARLEAGAAALAAGREVWGGGRGFPPPGTPARGPNPEGEGWVPNIPQKGLSEWSDKDIAYFLETGQTPDGDTAGGSMARVIRNTSQLSPEDRAAMAEYVKSLPPVEGPKRPESK